MYKASRNPIVKCCWLFIISSLLATPVWAAPEYAPEKLSPNIALNSYVYGYLEKLSGLGYISGVLPGTKPYTRMQAAKWVMSIDPTKLDDANTPAYVRSIIRNLEVEFSSELNVLQNGSSPSFGLREISVDAVYYNGDTLANQHTKSSYQPLNINNNGYRFNSGANGVTRLRLEGTLGTSLLASLTPRLDLRHEDAADTSLESAYIKTAWGKWELQAGKDAMWWGQGLRGTRALTNNAEPVYGVKISTIEPLKASGVFKPLREISITSFYGRMTDDRSANDVQNPGFFGFRTDVRPHKNLTIGTSLTSMLGGDGRGLGWGDFWDFVSGHNAQDPSKDKWNTIAGLDFRLSMPHSKGLQLYGELYGEDQATALGFIPTPSKNSGLLGIYMPRLSASGDWDAAFEWAHTSESWYKHWVYKDGYVNSGNIVGDAMGWHARRYYARFNHYDHNANLYSLNLEHLAQLGSPVTQKVDAVWLSHQRRLAADQFINFSLGHAWLKNANYVAGKTKHSNMYSLSFVQEY